MKIAVCVKYTPDTEDVIVNADGSVDLSYAAWNVSDYDLQAIQAAADLSQDGDEVFAITVGGANIATTALAKALLRHGNIASLIRIADNELNGADASVVARILAKAIQNAGADLAFFGEGSSDRYSRTMGSLVAAELGWPCATCADEITREDDVMVIQRDLEDGLEETEMIFPCVIVTTTTINTPPIPNMKAILSAGKKPVLNVTLEELAIDTVPGIETLSQMIPAKPGRSGEMLEGSAADIAASLVARLRTDQVL